MGSSRTDQVDLIVFQRSKWLDTVAPSLPCKVHVIELGGITKLSPYLGFWKLFSYFASNSLMWAYILSDCKRRGCGRSQVRERQRRSC